MNQIAIQLPWHHFGGKKYWSGQKKKKGIQRRAQDLENESVS